MPVWQLFQCAIHSGSLHRPFMAGSPPHALLLPARLMFSRQVSTASWRNAFIADVEPGEIDKCGQVDPTINEILPMIRYCVILSFSTTASRFLT